MGERGGQWRGKGMGRGVGGSGRRCGGGGERGRGDVGGVKGVREGVG